jgi:hypothetical protein
LKPHYLFVALAVAAATSGCQSFGGGGGTPVAVAPPAIEGDWVGAEGLVSSFRGGVFQTRTTDTGEVLATGNYVEQAGGVVQIDVQSKVRAPQTVNCLKAAPDANGAFSQMNCTSSTGSQFSLSRRPVATG